MRYQLLLICVVACLFGYTQSVSAALLYIDPVEDEAFRGDTFTLAVRVDPDPGECINTVDAVISYDASIRAVDISRGDSILSIWVEEPVIDEDAHTIRFAGGIPGGYCGRIAGDPRLTNVVAELIFRVPGLTIGAGSSPTAHVSFNESSQVLQNDGFGTPAPLTFQNATIRLIDSPGTSVADDWNTEVEDDDVSPAEFSIVLTNNESVFSGKHYIVFNTLDKQSGIDHYEVMEEPFEDFNLFSWGAVNAPWTTVQSPYVLKDQTLNSTIRVKAIDKAGNETISTLVPNEALRTISMQRLIAFGIIGTIVLIIFAALTFAFFQNRRRYSVVTSNEETEAPKIEVAPPVKKKVKS